MAQSAARLQPRWLKVFAVNANRPSASALPAWPGRAVDRQKNRSAWSLPRSRTVKIRKSLSAHFSATVTAYDAGPRNKRWTWYGANSCDMRIFIALDIPDEIRTRLIE